MNTPSSLPRTSSDSRPNVTNNIRNQTINNTTNNTTFDRCSIRCNSVNGAAGEPTTDDKKAQCDSEKNASKKILQAIVMLIGSSQQLVGRFILTLPRTPMEKILTRLIMVLVLRTQMAMILTGTQESPYISY